MDCMRALCAVTTMTFEICRFGQEVILSGGGPDLFLDALDFASFRASGRLLVEADHVSSRIAEARGDFGGVRAEGLDDLASVG